MENFRKNELFTATEAVRNFSSILKKLNDGEIKRAIIVKNSKFEAVTITMGEYERLQNAVMLLEQIYAKNKKGE